MINIDPGGKYTTKQSHKFSFVRNVMTFGLCLAILQSMFARAQEMYPIYVAITNSIVGEATQPALVEPWIVTDGKKFLFINSFCNGERGNPDSAVYKNMTKARIGELDAICSRNTATAIGESVDGKTRLYGLNNRGERVTLAEVKLLETRPFILGGNAKIASNSVGSAREWNAEFSDVSEGMLGIYFVSSSIDILEKIVPVSRASAQLARETLGAQLKNLIQGMRVSRDACSPAEHGAQDVLKCIDGWYPAGKPSPMVPANEIRPGVLNAYFTPTRKTGGDLLVIGIEQPMLEPGSKKPRPSVTEQPETASMSLVMLTRKGRAWIRSKFSRRQAEKRSTAPFEWTYEALLFVPRGTINLGGCSYIATALDTLTESQVLFSQNSSGVTCKTAETYLRHVESDD